MLVQVSLDMWVNTDYIVRIEELPVKGVRGSHRLHMKGMFVDIDQDVVVDLLKLCGVPDEFYDGEDNGSATS